MRGGEPIEAKPSEVDRYRSARTSSTSLQRRLGFDCRPTLRVNNLAGHRPVHHGPQGDTGAKLRRRRVLAPLKREATTTSRNDLGTGGDGTSREPVAEAKLESDHRSSLERPAGLYGAAWGDKAEGEPGVQEREEAAAAAGARVDAGSAGHADGAGMGVGEGTPGGVEAKRSHRWMCLTVYSQRLQSSVYYKHLQEETSDNRYLFMLMMWRCLSGQLRKRCL